MRALGFVVSEIIAPHSYHLALVVVRPALLPRLQELLGEVELLILAVTEVNRDDLPREILTLYNRKGDES